MARLVISQKRKGKFNLALPHYILINGKNIGLMNTPSVTLEVPPATFEVRIQSMFKWFYSSAVITTHDETDTFIEFSDREKWWDVLFVVDVILWCIKGSSTSLRRGRGFTKSSRTDTSWPGLCTSG